MNIVYQIVYRNSNGKVVHILPMCIRTIATLYHGEIRINENQENVTPFNLREIARAFAPI
jgi:hypothetical protein